MTATAENERDFTRVHFIGVGGAGMSGIALVLHERGYQVSGSDLKTSRYVRQLTRAGVDVRVGHEARTIDEVRPEVVVISSAIPESNPELIRARELSIPVWPRAKMLSYLGHGKTTIAVAGTHGKTTTSSMCATMVDRMGLEPSFLIGGIVEGYGTNGKNGAGDYFVAEADESDGSFLYLEPTIAVVTNVEEDHMDHYSSLQEIEETFAKFMGLVGDEGTVVVCGDDPHLVELARSTGRKVLSYGFDPSCDVVCEGHPVERSIESHMTVHFADGASYDVTIAHNPGAHNMLNATACMAVAQACGFDRAEAARALSTFEGARRRFTHVGDVNGITVVDDYGHHPTEVKATLAAAKSLHFDRVVTVFQPHALRPRGHGLPAAPLLAPSGASAPVCRRLRRCRRRGSHRRVPGGRDAHPGRHEQAARRRYPRGPSGQGRSLRRLAPRRYRRARGAVPGGRPSHHHGRG